MSACSAPQVPGEMRPTIPKSIKPTLPSGRTNRFPACTSAWKDSHASTLPNHVLSAAMRVASGSPREKRRMVSRSVRATPLRRSITSTLRELRAGYTKGTTASRMPEAVRNAWKAAMFWASFVKSTSSSMPARMSATMLASDVRLSSGWMNSSTREATSRKLRSTAQEGYHKEGGGGKGGGGES